MHQKKRKKVYHITQEIEHELEEDVMKVSLYAYTLSELKLLCADMHMIIIKHFGIGWGLPIGQGVKIMCAYRCFNVQ